MVDETPVESEAKRPRTDPAPAPAQQYHLIVLHFKARNEVKIYGWGDKVKFGKEIREELVEARGSGKHLAAIVHWIQNGEYVFEDAIGKRLAKLDRQDDWYDVGRVDRFESRA